MVWLWCNKCDGLKEVVSADAESLVFECGHKKKDKDPVTRMFLSGGKVNG